MMIGDSIQPCGISENCVAYVSIIVGGAILFGSSVTLSAVAP